MAWSMVLLAGLFLPLFPLSMIFNQGFARISSPWPRVLLLLVWPQLGVFLVAEMGRPLADWLIAWALLSALLYAFRALALREAGQWIGFLATSAWALLWLGGAEPRMMHLQALGFSVPLALMALLTAVVENRLGAAHTALGGGLAVSAPRLAALFAVAILAAAATPLFPGVFVMIAAVTGPVAASPLVAVGLLLVWLLWTWSGARLLQGLLVGPERQEHITDLGLFFTSVFSVAYLALALAGILFAGDLL